MFEKTKLINTTISTITAGTEAAAAVTFADKTVQITELGVPASPTAGQNVTLSCRFRLGGSGHQLYTVNWWRGKDQFYTYKGSNYEPKHAYSFRGIRVLVRTWMRKREKQKER